MPFIIKNFGHLQLLHFLDHLDNLFVEIFLPLTILVEVGIDLKLPIPLLLNDVEENEVRLSHPSELKAVNPVSKENLPPEDGNSLKAEENDLSALAPASMGTLLTPQKIL